MNEKEKYLVKQLQVRDNALASLKKKLASLQQTPLPGPMVVPSSTQQQTPRLGHLGISGTVEECGICWNELTENPFADEYEVTVPDLGFTLQCGHRFHAACVHRCLQLRAVSDRCVVCSSPIVDADKTAIAEQEKRNTDKERRAQSSWLRDLDRLPVDIGLAPLSDRIRSICDLTGDPEHDHQVLEDDAEGSHSSSCSTSCESSDRQHDAACSRCGLATDPDQLLLCDFCPKIFHIGCLNPPLASVPTTPLWKCPDPECEQRWCNALDSVPATSLMDHVPPDNHPLVSYSDSDGGFATPAAGPGSDSGASSTSSAPSASPQGSSGEYMRSPDQNVSNNAHPSETFSAYEKRIFDYYRTHDPSPFTVVQGRTVIGSISKEGTEARNSLVKRGLLICCRRKRNRLYHLSGTTCLFCENTPVVCASLEKKSPQDEFPASQSSLPDPCVSPAASSGLAAERGTRGKTVSPVAVGSSTTDRLSKRSVEHSSDSSSNGHANGEERAVKKSKKQRTHRELERDRNEALLAAVAASGGRSRRQTVKLKL